MSKSPSFQFYPKDFLSDKNVELMTNEELGGYIRLLCHCWLENGLPDDDDQLARLSRLGEGWFKGGSTILRGCFKKRNKKLQHKRLLAEQKKQRAWREKSSAGGKASAKSRTSKGLQKPYSPKGGSTKDEPKGNTTTPSATATAVVKKKGKRKGFVPPTLEDVRAYIAANPELQNVDPEHFWKGFNDGGWIDTHGNPVRNWKLKIRTWSRQNGRTAGNRRNTDFDFDKEADVDSVEVPA